MGMLDSLLKGALGGGQGSSALGGLMDMVAKNPQILSAVAGLLSTRNTSVGGSGGLGGLISAFQGKGLGDMMSSWISTGPNPPISAAQVTNVLGDDTMGQFARKAGIPMGEAGSILAGLLPTVIDKLTPEGKVPDPNSLDTMLSSLLGKLA